jgi:uncharacterized membrane protein
MSGRGALPAPDAIPTATTSERIPMEAPLELIVSIFDEPGRADEVHKELKEVVSHGDFQFHNVAILVKDEKGNVRVHETEDVGPGRGALFGAITGALMGLLGGPAGAVIGAAAGAATGGITAAVVDMGFSNDQLNELKASMPANSSALVALIEHTWVDRLVDQLERQRGKMFRHEVAPGLVNQYRD